MDLTQPFNAASSVVVIEQGSLGARAIPGK